MTIFASAKYNAECFRGLHREARSFPISFFSIYGYTLLLKHCRWEHVCVCVSPDCIVPCTRSIISPHQLATYITSLSVYCYILVQIFKQSLALYIYKCPPLYYVHTKTDNNIITANILQPFIAWGWCAPILAGHGVYPQLSLLPQTVGVSPDNCN